MVLIFFYTRCGYGWFWSLGFGIGDSHGSVVELVVLWVWFCEWNGFHGTRY